MQEAHKEHTTAELVIRHSRIWDRVGIFISGLCMIHCLATPLLVMFYPAFMPHDKDGYIHLILLPLVISIASISFYTSYLRHKNKGPILSGSIGVVLLLFSLIFLDGHSYGALWFTVFGSGIILFSHAWNMRACHCFCEASCSHESHDH